ncbi:hypothetical protein C826_00016 [Helicobacter bilis WiWa]|uniref:Uncharacterized protein n=1 Tax=Helicobacter bilis WiWa TaxID=1235804 RepID=N2BLD2_9HELI|nr:hypothetical protein [Helicobacter bilis]EMZ41011.1 hypothetical protein C826_00016 [Helicobacter bilis WiWa]
MKQRVSAQYSSNDFLVLENKAIYFAKENDCIDCVEIAKIANIEHIYISWFGLLLTGGAESNLPHNECFFGTLDSKDSNLGLDTLQPIYQLISNLDSEFLESKINFTESSNTLSTLHIFLNNSTLTILNYSLLDSSLNIKLECKSTESKEILEREKAQREKQKEKDSQTIDSTTSTAFLHPILEDNELKCPHNGVVKLKSNKGKPFKSKGIPMVLESDLLHSSIIGCTNPILSGGPCTMVATILPNARGLKKFNDDYPIMQDLCISGVMSDKGFPLIATPKPNTFKINSPKPIDSNTQNKQKLESQINLYRPTLRLHYKITPLQKDNLPIYRLKLNDSIIESNNDTPLDSITIDIAKDTKDLHDIHNLDKALQDILSILHSNLKQSFMKEYIYKYISLQLDSNMLLVILLIPQKIPKIYKEAYKEYHDKEYGVGRYTYVYEYCYHKDLDIKDYAKTGLDSNPSNATILTLHTAYKAQKLEVTLANGLDSILESRDKEHNTDTILTLHVINGGYEEKHWGFREETENKDTQANPVQTNINTESKDSKATQENKDKQILEMYFSYGEECERLQEDSRHSSDVNLHIITQGYNNGEEVEVELGTRTQKIIVNGKVNNNEVVIQDIESKFKRK